MKNQNLKGLTLVIMCAFMWALNGNMGSYLFQYKNFTPGLLVSYRLLGAGIFLTVYNYIKQKDKIFLIFKTKHNIFLLLTYALGGLLLMQYSYFMAISYSNAPTATIIQYMGAFIIIFYSVIFHKAEVTKKIFFALLISFLGIYLLITHGKPDALEVSSMALFYGVLSMIGYAIYNLAPIKLSHYYDSVSIVSFGLLISGVVVSIYLRPFSQISAIDIQSFLAVSYCIFFGTLLPFVLFIEGQKLVGASTASIFAFTEPLFSTFISVVWLGTKFLLVDYIGVILVVVAIILLSTNK